MSYQYEVNTSSNFIYNFPFRIAKMHLLPYSWRFNNNSQLKLNTMLRDSIFITPPTIRKFRMGSMTTIKDMWKSAQIKVDQKKIPIKESAIKCLRKMGRSLI